MKVYSPWGEPKSFFHNGAEYVLAPKGDTDLDSVVAKHAIKKLSVSGVRCLDGDRDRDNVVRKHANEAHAQYLVNQSTPVPGHMPVAVAPTVVAPASEVTVPHTPNAHGESPITLNDDRPRHGHQNVPSYSDPDDVIPPVEDPSPVPGDPNRISLEPTEPERKEPVIREEPLPVEDANRKATHETTETNEAHERAALDAAQEADREENRTRDAGRDAHREANRTREDDANREANRLASRPLYRDPDNAMKRGKKNR